MGLCPHSKTPSLPVLCLRRMSTRSRLRHNLDEQLLAEFIACEADLLSDAGNQRVETFERGCRDLARHLAAKHQADSDAEELDTQRRN